MSEGDSKGGQPRARGLRALRSAPIAWRRLSPFFRGSRSRIALLVALSVTTGLIEAMLLALIATMAAAIAQDEQSIALTIGPIALEESRATTFVIAIALALLRAGLQVILAYVPAQLSARLLAELREQLFTAFTETSWSIKSEERDGDFQTLMTQYVTNVAQAVVVLGTGVTATLMFTVMVIGAFVQSAIAAAVLTVAACALFFALRPLSRRLRGHARELSEEAMQFTESVQEVVLVAEETEVFGATPSYRATFRQQIDAVRRPHARTRFLAVALPAMYQSIALLMLVIALIGISIAGIGQLAQLAAVILMLIRALTYGQQIQSTLTAIDERLPYMNQIVETLNRYRQNAQQDGALDLDSVQQLDVSDISFAYKAGVEVLHGVTFRVSRGEAIGIVGPSGAGKSSLVQLLLRLREPGSGAVRVNGRDVRELARSSWQQRVSYVPQTSQLIWGTVRDNIRFYRDWLDDAQVETAARRAHIHDEIMSWADGYDTVISQRVSAVSGGQRQRICLARALAGDPAILVLDEPTSALDVRSEELVQQSLEEIKADTILVLVAHRLSTLSVCDRIVVMVDGRVSAIGTHDDLLDHSDFFREVTEITQRQTVQG